MRVLVSDTSVIIDVERGALLNDWFRLPFEFAVPDLLFHRELSGPLGDQLIGRGLRVEELTPGEVTRATAVLRQRTDLSVPDTFAFSLAAARGWALLTDHGTLRQLAITKKIEVYGVLWLFDQLEAGRLLPLRKLRDALTSISEDPRCRLPAAEIKRRLERYGK